MQPYPHTYSVTARGATSGLVPVEAQGLPHLDTAPPLEFDGPGDVWSPETLLVAAIADCFILTFRAISRAGKFEWVELQCAVEGIVDRVNGVTRFSGYSTRATLTVKPGADHAKGEALLERAERVCLVSNSLVGERRLTASVVEL